MAFDKYTMRAVVVKLDGNQIAGFKERSTGHFHAMMKIDSALDIDRFMEIHDLAVISIE